MCNRKLRLLSFRLLLNTTNHLGNIFSFVDYYYVVIREAEILDAKSLLLSVFVKIAFMVLNLMVPQFLATFPAQDVIKMNNNNNNNKNNNLYLYYVLSERNIV